MFAIPSSCSRIQHLSPGANYNAAAITTNPTAQPTGRPGILPAHISNPQKPQSPDSTGAQTKQAHTSPPLLRSYRQQPPLNPIGRYTPQAQIQYHLRPSHDIATQAIVTMASKTLRLPPRLSPLSRSLLPSPPCAPLSLSSPPKSRQHSSGFYPPRRNLSTTPAKTSQWLLNTLSSFASASQSSSHSSPPQPKTISTKRILPYPPSKIYSLVADIDSYSSFLPNCASSRVTHTTPSPSSLPSLADLTVGWGPFTQTYTSRVYCVPHTTVEAVSGNADPSTSPEVLQKQGYNLDEINKRKKMDGIFESLVTKWTIKPVPRKNGGDNWSEVSLSVTFQFANPALGFAVGQLADDKATEMVAAFEERARRLYGVPK
ncbi:dehydrase and lipid transport-domain-containing protein [Podospora australis]|uniref:Dehydrase and lipid transport-domain-containing protein n=1 Tax=Podospora australis TaxID=1536484 RepID=A0AAN6X6C4_9PEZI|nr:dehydrase and lipid transport-domain-containing protein [Podospora australis]